MPAPLPDDLVARTAQGNTVLFVGSGMSQPQFPGWSGLLLRMLEWCGRQKLLVTADQDSIGELIASNELPLAAQELRNRMGPTSFCQFLREVFREHVPVPEPVHKCVSTLGFSYVLTTNYDKLLEASFPAATPWYTQLDYPGLAGATREQSFCIVKVHGDVDRCDSVILGQADYSGAIFGNESFRTFLTNIFTSKTVLFVGCSLTDPDFLLLLRELKFQLKGHLGTHFGLMRTKGMNPMLRRDFEVSYGIRALGDDDRDEHPDIRAFFSDLHNAVTLYSLALSKGKSLPTAERSKTAEVQKTIELLGQRLISEQTQERLTFVGEYRVGNGVWKVATCYAPLGLTQLDLMAFIHETSIIQPNERLVWTETLIPESLFNAAASLNIGIFQRDSYIDHLLTGVYLKRLEADQQSSTSQTLVVPLSVSSLDQGRPDAFNSFPLDTKVEQWLRSQDSRVILLTGAFGSGKTWFLKRIAAYLSGVQNRIPFYLSLAEFRSHTGLETGIAQSLANSLRLGALSDENIVDRLRGKNRLLLLLDGFSELATRESDFSLVTLLRVIRRSYPTAKTVITLRSHFFESDLKEQLEHIGAEDVYAMEIDELSERQLRHAFKKRFPELPEEEFDALRAFEPACNIKSRPVLLELLGGRSNVKRSDFICSLYDFYIDTCLASSGDRKNKLSTFERRVFAEDMAFTLHVSRKQRAALGPLSSALPNGLLFENSSDSAQLLRSELCSRSLFERHEDDQISFSDPSFLIYFLAQKLARLITQGQCPACRLTDHIVRFITWFLSDMYTYSAVHRDGMCRIPDGPFIFGSERRNDLAIVSLQASFWIDRLPVTNGEFVRFLNAKGNGREGENRWFDNTLSHVSVRRDHYEVNQGYEDVPVVGVTWDGANAYATWKRKRLPSEIEWEKAARGVDGRMYPWGTEFGAQRCTTAESGSDQPKPVGKSAIFPGQSPYGCEDMAGNIWEWTATAWADDVRTKVIRGGSWQNSRHYASNAHKDGAPPFHHSPCIGFRCVSEIP